MSEIIAKAVFNPLRTMWSVQRVVNGLGMKNL
jgi:hypothetical protein